MARDFDGDVYDFQNMTDDEIRGVILEHLGEYQTLDADDIDIDVQNGMVTLSGRVGTDAEVETATALLDDVLGLDRYANDLVVDELRRGGMPAGATDRFRDADDQQSDTAEHLVEDLESETYGTHDVGKAIRDASPYSPPDRPGSDGYTSRGDH